MDPTQLLRKQHRRVEQLFKQIEKADDPGQCRQLLDELTRDLERHTRIEETIFYPALRNSDPRRPRRWCWRPTRSMGW